MDKKRKAFYEFHEDRVGEAHGDVKILRSIGEDETFLMPQTMTDKFIIRDSSGVPVAEVTGATDALNAVGLFFDALRDMRSKEKVKEVV